MMLYDPRFDASAGLVGDDLVEMDKTTRHLIGIIWRIVTRWSL